MSLSVVGIERSAAGNTATVTVKSDKPASVDAYEELRSMTARSLAVEYAAKEGMAAPHVNDSVNVFSAQADGKPVTSPQEKAAFFAATVPLMSKVI